MPGFVKGGALRTPFGRNYYLRSTVGIRYESYTVAAATVFPTYIDTYGNQKILQPGTVLAKITSGPDAGKVGPFQAAIGVLEVQTLTASGTISGGTFVASYNGQQTPALAWNTVAADLQTALNALTNIRDAGGVTVSGGPLSSAPFTITANEGINISQIAVDASLLTGSTPGVTAATTTQGAGGAADGRSTLANIVGINDTFLPWQLIERDVEVAVAYNCSAVQGWCFEMDANGLFIPLTNTTASAMQRAGAAGKSVDINWK